jgi:ring-1,2-phenylacetyl-CoA epoxidase subunit PaaE
MLTFHSLRVVEVHPEAEDAVGISLEVPPDLRAEYQGLPGQHVVVRTQINDEEDRRTYSLVSAPGELPLRIVVRVHPSGKMSRYLAEQLNVGDTLDVLPPNGSFTPRRAAQEAGTYVAFASGGHFWQPTTATGSFCSMGTRARAVPCALKNCWV